MGLVHSIEIRPSERTVARRHVENFPGYFPNSQRLNILHPNGSLNIVQKDGFCNMTGSGKSPLGRLVLFIICLSVAGAFVAGVHWYAIDLPLQESLQAPSNSIGGSDVSACIAQCDAQAQECYQRYETIACTVQNGVCVDNCSAGE